MPDLGGHRMVSHDTSSGLPGSSRVSERMEMEMLPKERNVTRKDYWDFPL